MTDTLFPTALDAHALERGEALTPSFNAEGLIAAILQHAQTDEVLMQGWMNAEALKRTLDSGGRFKVRSCIAQVMRALSISRVTSLSGQRM